MELQGLDLYAFRLFFLCLSPVPFLSVPLSFQVPPDSLCDSFSLLTKAKHVYI